MSVNRAVNAQALSSSSLGLSSHSYLLVAT